MKQKYFSNYKKPLIPLPDLTEAQISSFKKFMDEGVRALFKEFSPITDYSAKKFELHFLDVAFGEPAYDEFHAKENKLDLQIQLKARVKLVNKTLGTEKEQEVFVADFPVQTGHGTFVINGVERVIVPQLIRSFGVLFSTQEFKGREYFGAKIIPSRGAWIEIETEPNGSLQVRIDRKRKFGATHLLRVLGGAGADIKSLFAGDAPALDMVEKTLRHDTAKNQDESFVEIYKKLRDGELATIDNAREFVKSIFASERYDLSEVGRFRFNQRFDKPLDKKSLQKRTLDLEDFVLIIKHIAKLNSTPGSEADDVDDLGSRRVRYVGELLEQNMRVGLMRMKRTIQDRMSIIDAETTLPAQIVNPRPLQARIREFYTANALSQFMDQVNALAELEHLRTLSALGPGGLSRERAGFEVRDVHTSHYGRVCPIHTPEGPNIGLILHLSAYARVNDFGIIETPYAKVEKGIVTKHIEYLNARDEENVRIAHAGTNRDEEGRITDARVEVRLSGRPAFVAPEEVDYIDVAPNQAYSIATSLIPFLNHDEANRALMASNMQKQAVPTIRPAAPLVATGVEERAAADSGRLIFARQAGVVKEADARHIVVRPEGSRKDDEYPLVNFSRTNGFSSFHQRPAVNVGDQVKKGDLLADTSTSVGGQLALGQNLLVAFMSWGGNNFEDAIVISERLVRDQTLTSIHVEEFDVNVRDTKLGPEVTTNDIPNVGEAKLKNLDEDGVIRIGSEVRPGDILVGKITPKGETQLTPEERLLRSIFGDKARDVKDTSLRMEGGKRGRVVGVKVFSRERGDSMESGISKKIYIEVAQLRNISVGDKLAGRHGNKGVISRVVPVEDMPRMADGTAIDVVLTPMGVPSRMNLGQILELHLGLAAHTLNYQAVVPPFMGATHAEVREELQKAGFSETGKMKLYDGRTGEAFQEDVSVGYMYILKLEHMVEDKIHMRSIGPYSLITQQPLGGRAQNGGQRFGEMEVWALLGYGAAYTLREMLTVKSDDIVGRSAAFDAIVRGAPLALPNAPASFGVLLNYLKGLGLDVDLKVEKEK